MNTCEYCGKEYEAKRSDSRTCSPQCRKALSRKCDTIKCDTDNKCDNVTDKTVTPKRLLTQEMIDSLPQGVVKPTGQPDEHTATMRHDQLQDMSRGDTNWQASPAYADTIYRLLTGEAETGQFIPCWKAMAC